MTRRRGAWLDARNQKRLRRVKVSTSRVRWTSCMYVCMYVCVKDGSLTFVVTPNGCSRSIWTFCNCKASLHLSELAMVHGGRGRGPRTKPSETKFALPLSRFYSDRFQTLCVGVWYIYVSAHVLSEPKTSCRSGNCPTSTGKEGWVQTKRVPVSSAPLIVRYLAMSDDDPLDSAVTLIGAIDQGTQSSRFIVYNPKDLSVPVGCVVP